MKHSYLALAIILLILSTVSGDTKIQFNVNDNRIPAYSNRDNPKVNCRTEKSKQEVYTGLNFSVGIVLPDNSL
jgi:hypothetical protein